MRFQPLFKFFWCSQRIALKILLFQVVNLLKQDMNLLFQVMNLLFQGVNLLFQDANLLFQVMILLFQVDLPEKTKLKSNLFGPIALP